MRTLHKAWYFVPAILLVCALLPFPYGYYQLLRFIICGTASLIAVSAYRQSLQQWVIVFGLIALLFNPFLPIHLDRSIWAIIDVACAVVYAVASRRSPRNSL
jgi:hypothetical protein